MRAIICAVSVVAMAATGCMAAGTFPSQTHVPNDGGNANAQGGLYVRNAFILNPGHVASPAPQLALYAVLINAGRRPARLERITVEGGGLVQLAGPTFLAPNQAVGTGERPIGTVTGVGAGTVPLIFHFTGAEPVRVYTPVHPRSGQYAHLPTAPAGGPPPLVRPAILTP
ncbi:hypothetical protein FH608_014100 [Nonomuraea phyllanthi]|uniref:Uncharacterized protein n=1 Tax=Nonomuraea phyllanthi TaxID=2219224 RepID=A0A5C4WP12_9ACTN|nr:hypothetical protein [Nonomuraea phyllanthi]KAB8195460.1 hypothetical protein FH608_014100 [Nonomuraea phyllanthi]